jgi:molybdopterin-containing oxidoreductase family membrane subunit
MADTKLHPVLEPGHTFETVTDRISDIVTEKRTPTGWFVGFGIAFLSYVT